MQLAVYKFRMLPAEFFRAQDPGLTPAQKAFLTRSWLADFDAANATSPVRLLKNNFPNCQDLGVATFTRIVMTSPGKEYTQDVIRIVTYATVNQQKKTLEELLEVNLTKRP